MAEEQTLARWLEGQAGTLAVGQAVAATVSALADAAARIAARLRRGPVAHAAAGDQPLRAAMRAEADAILLEAARTAPVARYATLTGEGVQTFDAEAPIALAIDPLDGSASLDANALVGTVFSILPAGSGAERSQGSEEAAAAFLRPGHEQLAAGYVLYGPATALVVTLGNGTAIFVLDAEDGPFRLVAPHVRTPENASSFAIDAGNYRHWEPPVRAYIDDCFEGADGPRYKDFQMRWLAALTAEIHRIMIYGGVFLCPRDKRPGHENGSMRHVFNAAPAAFVVEQAGGAASDGEHRLLDLTPSGLHGRVPLVFGSREKVAVVQRYHEDPDFQGPSAPLFGVRGLFRT